VAGRLGNQPGSVGFGKTESALSLTCSLQLGGVMRLPFIQEPGRAIRNKNVGKEEGVNEHRGIELLVTKVKIN